MDYDHMTVLKKIVVCECVSGTRLQKKNLLVCFMWIVIAADLTAYPSISPLGLNTQSVYRLDICHFMRRLATAVNSESHPLLYGPFMTSLSNAICEWNADDVGRLREAKRSELEVCVAVSEQTITESITKDEYERHCRRATRGTKETTN